MTTETTIRQLFETALAAINPALDTVWENTAYDPIGGTPYQQAFLLFADNQNPSFVGLTRYSGIFQVTLKYPAGVGTKDSVDRAGLIKAALPYRRTFTSGTITLTVQRTPTIAPGRNDGDRWAVPVKVPFFANVFE